MRTRIRNSIYLLAATIAGTQPAGARGFQAALPEIRSAGFYRVQLAPHASAVAGADLSSLRLRNVDGGEQPYLVQQFPQKAAVRLQLPVAGVRLPVAQLSQLDSSDKRTYIRVMLDEAFYIDELRVNFDGPRFYSRIMRMPETLPEWHQRFNQDRELVIGKPIRGRELLLVVENEDNPPLQVQNITISQHPQFLTAWLERGTYVLEYGDSAAATPRYDITVLRDTLSKMVLPLLQAGPPELVSKQRSRVEVASENNMKPRGKDYPSRTFLMWTIIGGILIALVLATRALVRRIGSGRDDT